MSRKTGFKTTIKFIFNFIPIFLLVIVALSPAQDAQIILKLKWGSEPDAAGIRKAPEARYGPPSFRVAGDEIQLLDAQNGRLKRIIKGKLFSSYPVSEYADDFLFVSGDEFYTLEDNRLYQTSNRQKRLFFIPDRGRIILSIINNQNQPVLNLSDGTHLTPKRGLPKQGAVQAGFKIQKGAVGLTRKDESAFRVVLYDVSGLEKNAFDISTENNTLGSLTLVGQDTTGRLFVLTEFIEQQVPLKVKREVYVLSPQGNHLAVVELSPLSFARVNHDIRIDKAGNLYQMVSSEEGIAVIRWRLSHIGRNNLPRVVPQPDLGLPKNVPHFNQVSPVPSELQKASSIEDFDDFPPVTPREALDIGDTYVQLGWQCTEDNITDGIITDSNGNKVRTPSWVQVGSKQKVPYKWGGFETIQQFIDGIGAKKYAGDNYTEGYGSYLAVGVDCSGFVSRCWKLPSHYSTRMMDDGLTLPYDSWDQVRPGDAVHKVGHVRLVVNNNSNGSIDVVEASGYDWRVSYRNYTYWDLSSYTPRYYVNMEGTPGNIPQPQFTKLITIPDAELHWQVGSSSDVGRLQLDYSEDGSSWHVSQYLNPDVRQCQETLGDSQAVYYKMKSISTDSVEGLPSDAYGLYRLDMYPKVLIVDGFDRISGSWPHVYHSFAVTHGQALQAAGVPFETVSNDAVIDGSVNLQDYAAVFWILGDESTVDETFNSEEQDIVAAYLRGGGKLFVSGSEIAWDLDHKGNTADQNFFHNYLKATYEQDDSESYTVTGNPATPFSGLTLHYDDGSHGVYEENYPDAVKPEGNAKIAFKYANDLVAAIYYEGLFPSGNKTGKLFYLAFPFETIYQENERFALIQDVVNFFKLGPMEIESGNFTGKITDFRLRGNYPNPFNGQTRIDFQIPAAGEVTFDVYNTLGQKLFTRKRNYEVGGKHSYILNAIDFPSGMYFYTLRYKNRVQRGRLTLVK